MKKIILTIVFLSLVSTAHAGIGACHDGNGKVTRFENRANPNYYQNTDRCIYFSLGGNSLTQSEYNELADLVKNYPLKYIKWGLSGRPELKTQAECEQADLVEQNAVKDAQRSAVDDLDVSAKDVVTALIKRINARLPQAQAITKQEIIDQIKADKGL